MAPHERAGGQSFWKEHGGAMLALVGVVAAAVIAAAVAVAGTLSTNWQQERNAQQQYQSDLVLRALEPDDVEAREVQLRFLLDTRLLTDEGIRAGLTAYLNGSNELPQFRTSQALAGMTQVAMDSASVDLPCHPSYVPCVPSASDVDCIGGSGQAPVLVSRVNVVGPDDYGIDTDGDGLGCE
jgi:hypothetical protein